jgi:hypothetical protein
VKEFQTEVQCFKDSFEEPLQQIPALRLMGHFTRKFRAAFLAVVLFLSIVAGAVKISHAQRPGNNPEQPAASLISADKSELQTVAKR